MLIQTASHRNQAITRADRRRRRGAKRAEIRARAALLRFTLAWANGELDDKPWKEFEAERDTLMWQYREARARLTLTLAGLPS